MSRRLDSDAGPQRPAEASGPAARGSGQAGSEGQGHPAVLMACALSGGGGGGGSGGGGQSGFGLAASRKPRCPAGSNLGKAQRRKQTSKGSPPPICPTTHFAEHSLWQGLRGSKNAPGSVNKRGGGLHKHAERLSQNVGVSTGQEAPARSQSLPAVLSPAGGTGASAPWCPEQRGGAGGAGSGRGTRRQARWSLAATRVGLECDERVVW